MTTEPWSLRRHLLQRTDVVVIFIDMDPSLNEEDLALPAPFGAAGPHAPPPPQTRYEIVRAALRSFWTQKERVATNLNRLSVAVYGVWDDVVELMPVTLSTQGAQHIDDALYHHLGESSRTYQGSSAPPSKLTSSRTKNVTEATSFPFHAVGEVLKKIRSEVQTKTRTLSSSMQTHTMVQGLLLLSRPSAPPVSAAPTHMDDDDAGECLLDVVCLGQLSQPSSACDVVVQQKGGRSIAQARGYVQLASTPTNAGESAASVRTCIDVPCAIIDPVAFTGISHKGLAVGPSLTKLLSLHQPHAKAFLERPLTVIDIPVASEEPVSERAHHSTIGPSRSSLSKSACHTASAAAADTLELGAQGETQTSSSGFTRVRAVATTNSVGESPVLASLHDSRFTSNAGGLRREPLSGRQRAETVGAHTTPAPTAATPPQREPRPPSTGEVPMPPVRIVTHKLAPPMPSSTSSTNRRDVPSRSNSGLSNGAKSQVSPAGGGATHKDGNDAASSASVGPSPPPGPRPRPQARVNSLTLDTSPSHMVNGTQTGPVAPSGRLPPRLLTGSARASPSITRNERLDKET